MDAPTNGDVVQDAEHIVSASWIRGLRARRNELEVRVADAYGRVAVARMRLTAAGQRSDPRALASSQAGLERALATADRACLEYDRIGEALAAALGLAFAARTGREWAAASPARHIATSCQDAGEPDKLRLRDLVVAKFMFMFMFWARRLRIGSGVRGTRDAERPGKTDPADQTGG